MRNQPLSSNDQGKLLIFLIMMTVSVVAIVGVIPAIFLAFGIYMMNNNKNFSSIDTAVKNFKGYLFILIIAGLISSFYFGYRYFFEERGYYFDDPFFASLTFSLVAALYIAAVQILFYTPLNNNRDWVIVNGIFSLKPKSFQERNSEPETEIRKDEDLGKYTVADELIKWAKLKEDGHVSSEEYSEVKAKLLKIKY